MHTPTRSHARAFRTLTALATLFFRDEHPLPNLELRLFPLLVGPTGVGKSRLVAEAAAAVGAKCLRLTRGDWLVLGTDQGRPTVWQILDMLLAHDRLCLHLDELDKFTDLQQNGWSAAIASDLWNILDRRINLTAYLEKLVDAGVQAPSESILTERLHRSLWIVGSGTWQQVYGRGPKSISGFQRPVPGEVDSTDIIRADQISPELLHRFNTDLLILKYPDAAETARLLQASGIAALARRLSLDIDPASVDWTRGGFRVLESIATRLCLKLARLQAPRATAAAIETAGIDLEDTDEPWSALTVTAGTPPSAR